MAPKGDDAEVEIHKLAHFHAGFRRVAMMLMAELPLEMEHLVYESEAVAKIVARGHGIVECQSHTGEVTAYIVVHNGTRYTTHTRPAWSKPEDIEIERRSLRPGTIGRDGLLRLAKEIDGISPEAYRKWGVQDVLDAVSKFSEVSESLPVEFHEIDALGEELTAFPDVLESKSQARNAAKACVNRVFADFFQLKIPGEAAKKWIGTMKFISLHPDPSQLFAVGTEFVSRLSSGQAVPTASIGLYLSHPKTCGRKSLITAKRAGRILRESGKQQCLKALDELTTVTFHEKLFNAFQLYLAARWLYEEMLFVEEHVVQRQGGPKLAPRNRLVNLTFGACTSSLSRPIQPRLPAPWAHQNYPIDRLPGGSRKYHC